MVFQDIVMGWPGSVQDSSVVRNSVLYETAAIIHSLVTHICLETGATLC